MNSSSLRGFPRNGVVLSEYDAGHWPRVARDALPHAPMRPASQSHTGNGRVAIPPASVRIVTSRAAIETRARRFRSEPGLNGNPQG